MKNWQRLVTLAASLLTGYAYIKFRREKKAMLETLQAGSNIMQTPYGKIEYSSRGEGIPILYLHSGGGGYEQGEAIAPIFSPEHQVISISRPGAYGSSIPGDGSYPAQAQMISAFLEQLDIEQCFVVSYSGGTPLALQFAIDFPEKCCGVIPISGVHPVAPHIPGIMWWVRLLRVLMSFDFLAWLMPYIGFVTISGNQPGDFDNDIMRNIYRSMFLVTHWREGTLNEIEHVIKLAQTGMALDKITAPVRVIHGTKDNLMTPDIAENTASKIKNAELKLIEGGTHLMIGSHTKEIAGYIREFIEVHH